MKSDSDKGLDDLGAGVEDSASRCCMTCVCLMTASLLSGWLALRALRDQLPSAARLSIDSDVEMSSRKSKAATASCSGLP